MRIGITGGTGFVGAHLADALLGQGHEVVAIARGPRPHDAGAAQPENLRQVSASILDPQRLTQALLGCEAVAHCAGISREVDDQTYDRIHVQGTRNVVEAAKQAAVRKLVLLSYLHARPDFDSPYHQTKWAAEEIVRSSGLDYTILKAGILYGRGDHMLAHMSQALRMFPAFAAVGLRERTIRPVAVEDVVVILCAALTGGRLSGKTVAVIGPEELRLSEAARRVAAVLNKRVLVFPMPLAFHYAFAGICERLMATPLATTAQVKMLSAGISEPLPGCEMVPDDLSPKRAFDAERIRAGLPVAGV